VDLEKLFGKVGDAVSVGRAFGPAIERNGTLIIPVAWVAGGGGRGGADVCAQVQPPGDETTEALAVPGCRVARRPHPLSG
jgi:hypothetical protein